jgi:hypothetical protein
MQITTATVFLFTVMGVVATPIESKPDRIDARDDAAVLFEHTGVSKTSYPTSW